jgi:hypothetical protein
MLGWCTRVTAVSAAAAVAMLALAVPLRLYEVRGQWALVQRTLLVGLVGALVLGAGSAVLLRRDVTSAVRSLRQGRRRRASAVAG